MTSEPCSECGDSGIITWKDGIIGYWSPCGCEAGDKLSAAIQQGEDDIRAGRLHKWSDIKREHKLD